MTDKDKRHQDRFRGTGAGRGGGFAPMDDTDEDSCSAFGYLRGIREKADCLEVRFKSGNSTWLPYNWFGSWKFDPSHGLLLKFSGDVVYLVLVTGSNLDRPLLDTTTNLTTSGLQRRRIVWIREMTEEEIRQVGESGPTIDSIHILEFESATELNKWLEENAPFFLPEH
ncbi:MAG TPA: hypothetical protein PK867_14290 [Pirellulales bacterium]|nr:hypothetical protein [Pirellulales bacterium]